MVMTRALTKRHKTCDNNGDSPSWSSMLNEILFKIILHLGVVDFIAFSGVCKSWRTVAHLNKKMFMLSRPPMHMSISTHLNKKIHCYLEDLKGRKFKTILPGCGYRTCLGSTCGYLIMFREETGDFKLLNLITRHELRFPCFPFIVCPDPENFRCALVFSPTMCSWGFVISMRFSRMVSIVFSSKRASWTHLQSDFPIYDLLSFQGKIYALSIGINLFEVTLGATPALTQLEMEPLVKSFVFPEFATLGGKLCVIGNRSEEKIRMGLLKLTLIK